MFIDPANLSVMAFPSSQDAMEITCAASPRLRGMASDKGNLENQEGPLRSFTHKFGGFRYLNY